MSIYKINPDDVESFTVVTNPLRTYTSSSTSGVEGSVYVFARRSPTEKETLLPTAFTDVSHDDSNVESMLHEVQGIARYALSDETSSYAVSARQKLYSKLDTYMSNVALLASSSRKHKFIDIVRFTPSVTFTSNTVKKLIVKDQLSSYYRTMYPSAHWAYTNYNCLNFFTASTVPTSSVLMYPNVDSGSIHTGYVSGSYVPSGAFSFDFYINPRYRPSREGEHFTAGTIFHLSSTFAVSLVTGSLKDENGLVSAFRIQLQLSHSADALPSVATRGTYPNDLIFLSDDNSLSFNKWHHVVVRWGTSTTNNGTGSFNVDGVDRGTFVIPSATIAPRLFPTGGKSSPDVLFIGNFYEGTNSGLNSTSYFFAADPAMRDGLVELNGAAGVDEPGSYSFRHPLNAELHDLAIKQYYMSNDDIAVSASVGPKSLDSWTSFYLPPFFTETSPTRRFVGSSGGVLQTPFLEVDGTTNDPFNVAMSFGVNGHYINIENFLRDFATNNYPRCHHMSGTAIAETTSTRSANEFLYDQPWVIRRNTLLLPCDDGLFVPSYELLASESLRTSAVDDLGVEELSYIHMGALLSTSSLLFGTDFNDDSSFTDEAIGFTPEQPGLPTGSAYNGYARAVERAVAAGTFDPGVQRGAPLPIYQRTLDASSNQVTFFDISNIFYGKRIFPGSVVLADSSFTASAGRMSITLKDDGRGTLYRADCLTSASTWNSVGTVFYDEGIIAIKSPHLYFFGKEGYEISFKGEQNVHVMRIDALAPANQLNSSSNPNFKAVPPSAYPNDPDTGFVYITGINFHDDNLNVIMKSQLAQPIVKRHGDRIMFRVKTDF